MRIQVLVAAVNQTDYSLAEKMNIRTDAIIGNQCDRNSVEEFDHNGNNIKYYSFAERGVGLNRNNTLMRADADICLFADDDMVYEDNYADIVEKAFSTNPTADVIVFNLKEKETTRKLITKKTKVGYLNYLRYGTARIAVRLSSIKKYGIYFNQCFGGGTEHCHGEDNLFLNACLKNGLKIIAVPEYIATLTNERASSWNNGYDEKYLHDQGILYRTLSKRWWRLLCLQDAVRRCGSYQMSCLKAYKLMIH
ncbi:MAG: glycosyltransferase family 2 protein [Oscillospiraceae bacterium]|nr:glycosyltransferase family 2 protein [Oscillospiraceae bacterium]